MIGLNPGYLLKYFLLYKKFLNFRDQIRSGDPDAFFVLNGDVCAEFPLREMLKFHQNAEEDIKATVLATEATKGMVCTKVI